MSPATPNRAVRVPDDLWTRFKAKATERGETATKALIRFMEWYVGDRRKP